MPIYNKPPLALLCDEINARLSPKLPLTPTNVRVRKVEVITTKDISKPNAKVTLSGRQAHGITGDITVNVRRIDLGVLFKNITPKIVAARTITMAEGARLLNSTYGLNLDVSDFRADINTDRPTFYLQPGALSLQYTGRVLVTIVDAIKELPRLRSLQLDQYQHPMVYDGRKGIDFASWGVDFTADASVITAVPQGVLANTSTVAALSSVLAAHGINVSLTGATLTRYSTMSQVPLGNQSYDSCAVVTGIDDKNYVGTLYLHYFNV